MTEQGEASEVSLSGEGLKGSVAQLLMAVIGFVGTVLFARMLGRDLLGAFYLVVALVELAERVMGGWATAALKRGSETAANRNAILGAQVVFNAAWLVVVTVTVLFFSEWFETYVGLSYAAFLIVALLTTEALYRTAVPIIQTSGKVGIATGVDALRSYVAIPVQIVLLLAGYGVLGLVIGLITGSLVTVPIAYWVHGLLPSIPNRETLSNLIGYARYSIPATVVSKAYERFDELLLGLLLVQGAVADYGIAARITIPALLISRTLSSGLFVRVSNLSSKGVNAIRDIENTLSFTSILAVPLFFGGLVIAAPLVRTLFGTEYPGAPELVIGLALYRLIQSQTNGLESTLNGLDKPDITFRLSALALGVNIVLGIWFTLLLNDALGVVIATVIAEAFRYVVFAWNVRQNIPEVSLLSSTLLKELGAGTVMAGIVAAVHAESPVRSWIDLSLLLLLGALIYGSVLLVWSKRTRTVVSTLVDGTEIVAYISAVVRRWLKRM